MWIFFNNAFLSIVADRKDKNQLLVRARICGHIEAVFPDAKVTVSDQSDYRYRAFVPRAVVAKKLAETAFTINYDNFKDSIQDAAFHDTAMNVWTTMYFAQRDELGAKLRGQKKMASA